MAVLFILKIEQTNAIHTLPTHIAKDLFILFILKYYMRDADAFKLKVKRLLSTTWRITCV